MTTIRVAVVDDQDLVREGFKSLLAMEPDIEVVGTASNGVEAVRLCRELKPDVIVMDIRMPMMDGIEATQRIRADSTLDATRIVILTTYNEENNVFEALQAGASGFLLKDVPVAELRAAVRLIAAGEGLLAPAVTRAVIEEFARRQGASTVTPAGGLADLTPREIEVVRLVAEGLSNSEIAERLIISHATVKTHLSRVLSKLDLRDRVQLVIAAYRSGLVQPGSAG